MEIKIGTKKSQVMTNDYASGPKCWGNHCWPNTMYCRGPGPGSVGSLDRCHYSLGLLNDFGVMYILFM